MKLKIINTLDLFFDVFLIIMVLLLILIAFPVVFIFLFLTSFLNLINIRLLIKRDQINNNVKNHFKKNHDTI